MKNIMCVDDSATMANIIENIIKKNFSNVTVTKVLDSTQVVLEMERNYYDVVITDINMPKLNGFDLVKQLRSDDTNRGLKIIAVSSDGSKNTIVKMLKMGADSFIVKPFKEDEVVEKLHLLLYGEVGGSERNEDVFVSFLRKMKKQFIEGKKYMDMHDKNLISEYTKKIEGQIHLDDQLSKFWEK